MAEPIEDGRAVRDAVRRLRRGDIQGLKVLVRTYQLRAVRAAYLITHDRSAAEDIVQTAFLRAWQRIDQYDPARPFFPYFVRGVINDAVKHVTRSGTVSLSAAVGQPEGVISDAPTLGDLLHDPTPDVEARIEAEERRQAVWDALNLLSADQAAAIIARYYLDFSEREMAAVLNCPPGTVKWRLHAARERLRELLTPQNDEEDAFVISLRRTR